MTDLESGTLRVMNILFDDRLGGPSKRVILVGKALAGRQIKTTLCLPEGNGNAASEAEKYGIPVRRIRFNRIPPPKNILRVIRWVLCLPKDIREFLRAYRSERPHVIHLSGAFFLAPALAARIKGIPIVWHVNDTIISKLIHFSRYR